MSIESFVKTSIAVPVSAQHPEISKSSMSRQVVSGDTQAFSPAVITLKFIVSGKQYGDGLQALVARRCG